MRFGRVAEEKARKKPYRKPELTEFGSVAHLTRGINGTNADAGQQANTKLGQGSEGGLG